MPISPSAFQARMASEEGSSPFMRRMPSMASMAAVAREAVRVAEDLREELAVLRDSIVARGLLTNERLQAEAHRRRFRALAARSSGWSCELGASLEDLSGGPLTRIASFLGQSTGLHFRCTSPAVEEACAKAASMYGPCFYAWGGFSGEKNLLTGEMFDAATGEWTPLPPLSEGTSGGACAAVAGKIYLAGGFDGRKNKSSAQRFDPEKMAWEVLPPMSTRRFACTASEFGGTFCVCGGNDGQLPLASVECFLPDPGEWRSLPPMSVQRIGAVVGALGGKLFVCGGRDLSSAEYFNQGRWARIPSMSEKRFGAAGGACAGCIYVCGGKGRGSPNLSSAERFDPAQGRWEVLPSMSTKRFGCAAESVKGKLYIFGGNEYGVLKFGGTRLSSVECFSPETGEWEDLLPMVEGRSGPFVAAVIRQAWVPEV